MDESDYQVPFRGKLHKLTMNLGQDELTPAQREMIFPTNCDKQQ